MPPLGRAIPSVSYPILELTVHVSAEIELRSVTKRWGDDEPAVSGVSFVARTWDLMALLGPSGLREVHQAPSHCRTGRPRLQERSLLLARTSPTLHPRNVMWRWFFNPMRFSLISRWRKTSSSG